MKIVSEHSRLCRSMLEWFDNIIKSIYILNYIDRLIIRQGVQNALNRGETYHKFKGVVFHAHQGKFRVKTELE